MTLKGVAPILRCDCEHAECSHSLNSVRCGNVAGPAEILLGHRVNLCAGCRVVHVATAGADAFRPVQS